MTRQGGPRIGLLAGAARWVRPAVLLALVALEDAVLAGSRSEEDAMDMLVLLLFALAPFLVWVTVEREPARPVDGPAPRGLPAWLRFPFTRGGASGVAYFLLVFAVVIGAYVVWLRFASRRAVWLADDDPVQLCIGALYACAYVLVPVGLCARVLDREWGRAIAFSCVVAAYPALAALLPPGPHGPRALTELGDPWDMIRTVRVDGTVVAYARDDLAVLAVLAALGIALNSPRVLRGWRRFRRRDRAARIERSASTSAGGA